MSKKYDLHMHFDLYKDKQQVLNYIEENKFYTLGMTNLPVLFEKYNAELETYKYFKLALGYHPELVNKYQDQLPVFYRNLSKTRYIGEVGLDFSKKYNAENRKVQKATFFDILNRTHGSKKIISIHSRGAVDDVIRMIKGHKSTIILHWYTGTAEQLGMLEHKDVYFSINQNMVLSKSGKELIKQLPLNRMLIESDAPFTNGMKDEYSFEFYGRIMGKIATIKNIPLDEIEEVLFSNFKRILL
jgi:TatD DNase family protein